MTNDELSREIAEKVMGFEYHENLGVQIACLKAYYTKPGVDNVIFPSGSVNYATDISQAFEVVEKMRARGWKEFDLTISEDGSAQAMFVNPDGDLPPANGTDLDGPARAICQAALQAVFIERLHGAEPLEGSG